LVETLRMMSARVVADVRVGASLRAKTLDEALLRSDPDVIRVVSQAYAALESAILTGASTV
jgi:hypothetical protein